MAKSEETHELSLHDGYADWSGQYDREGNALIALEERLSGPLLAKLAKDRVLDLGAGTGRHALRLAARGSTVVALDQSSAMMDLAKQKAAQAGLDMQFGHHVLGQPLALEAEPFDLAIAALVLCHVAELSTVAADAYRFLRPGGHFLITDFHPAVIAAGWRTQFSSAGRTYFLPTVQHTVDDYLVALQEAGFAIETVQEALVRESPPAFMPEEAISKDGEKPFCLLILAKKPN